MKDDDIAEHLAHTQDLQVSPERAAELWRVAERLNRVTLSAAMETGTLLGDPACFDKALVDCARGGERMIRTGGRRIKRRPPEQA